MDNDMSEELIQQQMQETRASLTVKIETLENKVVGTVENAATAVNETVDAIKETVHDTVATVQDGVKGSVDCVKELVDVPAQVQRRPWLMVGGAVAVGYCLGTLLTKRASSQNVSAPLAPAPGTRPFWMAEPQRELSPQSRAAIAPEPSMWASEVAKLKGLALGVLFGTARELIVSSVPEHMGDQVKDIVDSVTRKMGGEPLPASDWAKLCEPTDASNDQAAEPEPASNWPKQSGNGNGHPSAQRW